MIAITLSQATRTAGATLFVGALLLATASQAQISTPAPSPLSTITQRVGLTDVTITYSRPSAKNRAVFGDKALVSYGQRWRTGANGTTKIKFSDDVTIEGKKVVAGEYGLYSVPGKDSWSFVLSKDVKRGADVAGFKTDDDVATFTAKPYKLGAKVETFTINFTDLTPATANVDLQWESTGVKFKITSDVEGKVMAQINEKVINSASPNNADLAAAAVYYVDNNKDNKQALAWMQKANATDPKFWNLYSQAKLQLKMKDAKGAISAAEESKKLATAAKNDEYVRMNDALIMEAKKLK